MMLNLKYISNSKKGIERGKNQDRILIIENDSYYLFLIFDGVSSNPYSYLFIDEYIKNVKSKLKDIKKLEDYNLSIILYEAHKEILTSNMSGMSTLCVLFFNKLINNVKFINIGDSRIYLFSNQYLEQITTDDNLYGRKNIITKCLGLNTITLDDFKMNDVESGTNFLMCTDGFYCLMEESIKEYFEIINFRYFRNIERKLSILQRKKNKDDSSYIIIKNEVSN